MAGSGDAQLEAGERWCFLKWPLSPGKWGLTKGVPLCLKYLLGHGLVGVHFANKNLEKTVQGASEAADPQPLFPSTTV